MFLCHLVASYNNKRSTKISTKKYMCISNFMIVSQRGFMFRDFIYANIYFYILKLRKRDHTYRHGYAMTVLHLLNISGICASRHYNKFKKKWNAMGWKVAGAQTHSLNESWPLLICSKFKTTYSILYLLSSTHGGGGTLYYIYIIALTLFCETGTVVRRTVILIMLMYALFFCKYTIPKTIPP